MGYPVYYSGSLDVQPALSEDHAKLVEAVINMEQNEEAQAIFDAIKASDDCDLPYYGGQMYVSEGRAALEVHDGEQSHGVRLWLIHLLKHFFIPQGYTINGEISWDASDNPEDRGSIYIKDNAIEAVDVLLFDPGPTWDPNHFADASLKGAVETLLASADNTGCSPGLTIVSAEALNNVRELIAKTV